jgi:GT2 family glycosyltransferase
VSTPLWETFHKEATPWEEMTDKWKFTSTFCLSLKRATFFELGAFRRSFNKYGFEDTDLGYRADRAGLRFFRSSTPVYHFRHDRRRSEYNHSEKKKHRLLRDSARVFFLNNPNPEILKALPRLIGKEPTWPLGR